MAEADPRARPIRVATYNIHSGVGLDRRFAPERIVRVLREIDADVVALQEVQTHAHLDTFEYLRAETGLHLVAAPTMKIGDGQFGNALLTRFAITTSVLIDLSLPRREPRVAIDATLDTGGTPLRVIATHLGLRPSERQIQIERLLDTLRDGPSVPTVLMGDFNEWFMSRRALRRLHEHFGEPPTPTTFPSLLPLVALDRIWCAPAPALLSVRTHRSRAALVASDHLGVVGRVRF
jgi:endonuclease/exonuclease/phosphatase family metal-dependent hydrolase